MFTEHCVIKEGMHYGPPGCPHTWDEDEGGDIKPWGWTVQSNNSPEIGGIMEDDIDSR